MEPITVNCRGKNTLTARGGNLVVTHKSEEKIFPIKGIQSFSIKPPRLGSCGSITFTTAQAATSGINIGFGISAALGAEQVFLFWDEEYEAACRLRDYIVNFAEPAPEPAPMTISPAERQVVSVVEEIRGLKGLLDEGILTQEEFDAKKKQLLGL